MASEKLLASLTQLSAAAARAESARAASEERALAFEEAAKAMHAEVMGALSELSSRVEGIERQEAAGRAATDSAASMSAQDGLGTRTSTSMISG